jgi:hypothetical protein
MQFPGRVRGGAVEKGPTRRRYERMRTCLQSHPHSVERGNFDATHPRSEPNSVRTGNQVR